MKKICLSLFLFFICLACSTPKPEPFSVARDPEQVGRGLLLTKGLAACGFCHGAQASPNSLLSGGRAQEDVYGHVYAANITPDETGIADWSPTQVARGIRGAAGKDGSLLSPRVHRGYEWMGDQDVVAIVSYLSSLSPVEHEVERRDVGFYERNTKGLFVAHEEVDGYVPAINPRFRTAYGKYLVDHVARCTYCHNTESTIFTPAGYLAGGATVKTEAGEKVAPSLHSTAGGPLQHWSERDVVQYLQSGKTPTHEFMDSKFCPYEFYKNAPLSDLEAIAVYLKSL